ncbi:unnamed protein product [Linum tenue]|uniref:Uncharacterized protein n=1 Tax=Linum tenue TaxID=586396 RepID=A0AAV0P4E6_9ROSI|nr:unnamed protein product [Linum tenue]
MERLAVAFLMVMLMIGGEGVGGDVSGEKEKDRITDLPGLPAGTRLGFQQYAGYVSLFGGNQIFYYLVEYDGSSSSPAEETPLIMWFSAGRVCSSVGSGGMLDAGPLRVQRDGSLKLNPWALNKVANLLFVDFPGGVGFSTARNSSARHKEDVAWDADGFLQQWTSRFPEYKGRKLYLAAHLAIKLVPGVLRPIAGLRLQGLLRGNPLIDPDTYLKGFAEFASVKGMITDKSKNRIPKTTL